MVESLLERPGRAGQKAFRFSVVILNDLLDERICRKNTLVTHGLVTNITVTYVILLLL